MRINEFQINRYGPLSDFSERRLPAFTLFYGPNERGKTLLIDALLRLLYRKGLKRHKKHFGNLDRISEEPEGFVVVESDGEEHKLEGAETISTLFPEPVAPVTPVDFRNVFMIRDSDLSVIEEKEYYTNVTEKLTGMRTNEIEKVMEKIRQKGRLTSVKADAPLSDSVDFEKVAGKIERAEELIGEIAALRERLADEGFDEMEGDLADVKELLTKTKKALDLQERAQKRERLEEAANRLEELEATLKTLDGMENIKEEDLKSWREAVWNRENMEKTLKKNTTRLEEEKEKLKVCLSNLQSRRSEVKTLQDIHNTFEVKLTPRLQECRRDREKIAGASAREGAFRWGRNISLGILLIALLGSFISTSLFFWIIGALALAGMLVFGWKILSLYHVRGRAAETFETLLLVVSEMGFEAGETLDEVLRTTREVQQKLETAKRETELLAREEEILRKESERLDKDIQNCRDSLRETEASIRGFQAVSGVASLEDLQKAIEKKREKQNKKVSLEAVLTSSLGASGSGGADPAEWRKAVERAKAEGEVSVGVTYDPGKVQSLEREKRILEERIGGLEGRLRARGEDIFRIQSKVTAAKLPIDTGQGHRTTAALEAVENQLEDFCEKVLKEAENAREALRIFEVIKDEEKGRVSGLFGKSSAVSKYFAETTDGRYTEVHFDTEASEIYAVQRDGTRIDAGCLSGGAFDQLYLAIRLSIGEQFLQGGKGFFIMDDPFIKSDYDRLSSQLHVLLRLAENGWQVLYFSAKKEVLEVLDGPITRGKVHLVELGELVAAEREQGV